MPETPGEWQQQRKHHKKNLANTQTPLTSVMLQLFELHIPAGRG